MNKQYSLEILDTVERGALENTSSLFLEAYNYYYALMNKRKKKLLIIEQENLQRFYHQKYK